MDLQGVSGRLRKLSPQQEKVIRLYFGLGCVSGPIPLGMNFARKH